MMRSLVAVPRGARLLAARRALCTVPPPTPGAGEGAAAPPPTEEAPAAAVFAPSDSPAADEVDDLVGGWYKAWASMDDKLQQDGKRKDTATKAQVRERKVDLQGRAHGLGRRKTAVANVWIQEGSGLFHVNGRPLADYFSMSDSWKDHAIEPFFPTGTLGRFDVKCRANGGGSGGQAGAVRLGLARALQNFDPELRGVLKANGMLTRDPRMVERKKPGQKKARKKFQWVKR